MSTDVASIMLPVSRGIMDRERDIDTAAGPLANAVGGPAAVRGMKRGDPEPDAQTAAALPDLTGAECKRPRIDGTGTVVGDIGQNNEPLNPGFHGYPPHSQTQSKEKREKGREKRLRLSGGERQKGPRGIRAAGPGRRRKERQSSDRQTRLACWRSGRRDVGKGKEEEEGVNEGEFECVRQTWTEAIVSSWS